MRDRYGNLFTAGTPWYVVTNNGRRQVIGLSCFTFQASDGQTTPSHAAGRLWVTDSFFPQQPFGLLFHSVCHPADFEATVPRQQVLTSTGPIKIPGNEVAPFDILYIQERDQTRTDGVPQQHSTVQRTSYI